MFVWDNHACMPLRPHDESFLPQLERAYRAGVRAITLNIGFGPHSIEEHIRVLANFRSWVARNGELCFLGCSADDVRVAALEDRIAVFFDIEGAGAIGDQLSLIQTYYDLGVRWMLIAYNRNNLVGGGCLDEDAGLTEFGRAFVDEMNRVGMMICCSHTGERTAREVIDQSTTPVIFSHSNAKAIYDHPRNISDEMIKTCAARGGVIGVNGIGIFLGDDDNSTETFIRHVDHMVELVGPDHVGISLDYVYDLQELEEFLSKMKSTFPGHPDTFKMVEPERLPEIELGLERLGYSSSSLRKIMGENWLRVAKQVWH